MSLRAAFAYGFRPLFLAAGVAAVVYIPWWAAVFTRGGGAPADWPASLWHAHEMLFGFVAAALTGFLLTAVPSWTGQRGFAGRPLALLVGLWFLGRLAVAAATHLSPWLVAVLDVAFLPALALMLAATLLRTRNRNAPLLLVLLALAAGNATFHRALALGDTALARASLLAVINLVLLLVTVIGGRIVPAFTRSGLRAPPTAGPIPEGRAPAMAAIGSMVLVLVVDLAAPGGALAGSVALLAALAQGARLLRWRGWQAWRLPIVWILHLAYAWLVAGLALKALALLAGVAFAAFWLHALTIGAAATMILAVMSRAALGHTGRPLVASPATVAAYGLLTAAAVLRVLGPAALHLPLPTAVLTAGVLWTAAFALFLGVYAPILTSPRADGRPG